MKTIATSGPRVKNLLTYLEENFIYEPTQGKLLAKAAISKRALTKGDPLGFSDQKGRYVFKFNGSEFRLSHAVWLFHYGTFPEKQIDHINGVRNDDRIENLREVSNAVNCRNKRQYKNNSSGYTGVSYNKSKGKYSAYVRIDYKQVELGLFYTAQDAAKARNAWLRNNKVGFTLEHGQ